MHISTHCSTEEALGALAVHGDPDQESRAVFYLRLRICRLTSSPDNGGEEEVLQDRDETGRQVL